MDLRPATPRALFFRGPSTAPPASPARDFFLLAFRQWLSEKCRDFGGGWRFSRLLVFTEVVLFKQAVELWKIECDDTATADTTCTAVSAAEKVANSRMRKEANSSNSMEKTNLELHSGTSQKAGDFVRRSQHGEF
uniref:Uncharacterized protein n=1 Tax=Leersia perrieri TaxID=77586 RepID=A0A0D9WRI5_9ORYZ